MCGGPHDPDTHPLCIFACLRGLTGICCTTLRAPSSGHAHRVERAGHAARQGNLTPLEQLEAALASSQERVEALEAQLAAQLATAAEELHVRRQAPTRRAVQPDKPAGPPRGIHVLVTSNGNAYMAWQTRAVYATYKQVSDARRLERARLMVFVGLSG